MRRDGRTWTSAPTRVLPGLAGAAARVLPNPAGAAARVSARAARAGRGRVPTRAAWVLACAAGVLAGCSSGAPHGAGVGATCGTARTAADVPVVIKVSRGAVDCVTALRVENEYAAKVRSGQVRGNGGGAPVSVGQWTCQGYPTPEVLSTGNASQCHTGTATILAVLPVPTPSGAAG